MKRTLFLLIAFLFCFIAGFSQVPDAFNYQAAVRNNLGEIISEKNVKFRISILKDSETGASVYSETHDVSTNQFGLVNLHIGKGTRLSGSFNPDAWGENHHFLKVELDPNGGNAFSAYGTAQLLSVPYAFHAQTVEVDNVNDADADPTNEIQNLSLSGTVLSLSKGGGTVTLPTAGGGGDNWGTQTVVSDATLIGNGTAASPLSVVGDLTDNQTLSLSGSDLSISGGNTVSLPAGGESLWTLNGNNIYRMTGFVGIGTNSPVEKLHVNGNIMVDESSSFRLKWGNYYGEIRADMENIEFLNYFGGGMKFYTSTTSGPSALLRMYITKEGKIGIGTNTPEEKLQIIDGSVKVDSHYGFKIKGSGAGAVFDTDGSIMRFLNYQGGPIEFYTAPTPSNTQTYIRMYIANDGNIGIGTLNPTAKLHLKGTGFPGSFMFLESNTGQDAGFRIYEGLSAKWHIFNNSAAGGLQIYNSATKTAIFAKQSNSFVGIGTTTPTQALHVVGNAYKTEGGTSWATSSDIRLKNLLGNYSKGLNEIIALQAVKYIYKKDNPRQLNFEKEQLGFVAQDVQKIFPEAISTADDGYLDFNFHPINVALVNAVKELKLENDNLSRKINELESKLEQLENYMKSGAMK